MEPCFCGHSEEEHDPWPICAECDCIHYDADDEGGA